MVFQEEDYMNRHIFPKPGFFHKFLNRLITRKSAKKDYRQWIGAFRNIPRFLALAWKGNRNLVLSSVLLRIFYSAIPVTILYVGKLIVDEVILIVESHNHHDLSRIVTFIAFEFVLTVCSSFLRRGIQANNRLVSEFFVNHSSLKLMEHASGLELDQFENPEFYDKLHRARYYTQNRVDSLIDIFDQIQDVFIFVTLLFSLLTFNPWLVVLLVLTSIPSLLSEFYFNRETYSFIENSTPERRELDYLCEISTSNQTVKEIKIFGLSDFFIKQFKNLSGRHYEKKRNITYKRTKWSLFFSILSSVGYYGSYALVVSSTIKGNISIGELTFFFGSFEWLKELLEISFDRLSKIAQSALHIQDYFDFFKMTPEAKQSPLRRPFPKPILFGFTFENVGFQYKGSDKWVVRNLSFSIDPKEKIAIVGENGAGKTTITKLLCRLYEPTEGAIYLDGHNIREYDIDDYHKEIGVIFQDFNKYNMSVADNIAVGRIDQKDDMNLIQLSANQSLADKFIEKLPQGYNQLLGKRHVKGIELSGGQWQKLALSRAFMRDAKLVILDEPSSALDPRSEYELFQRYIKYTQEKMVVLVSHRFSNVRMADRILVLKNGTLVESGSHRDLLFKQGLYAEMFNLQAQGYR